MKGPRARASEQIRALLRGIDRRKLSAAARAALKFQIENILKREGIE